MGAPIDRAPATGRQGGQTEAFALVISNDEQTRGEVRQLLQHLADTKYHVTCAEVSRTGGAGEAGGEPDLILLDCRSGGRENLERLRETVTTGCKAPVIALVASNDPQTYEAVLRAGAADCVAVSDLDSALLEHSIRTAIRWKRVQRADRTRLDFQETIISLSALFSHLDPDEVDRGISNALEALARLVEADRGYVFQFSEDGLRLSNTHEWCGKGIEPEIANWRDFPASTFPFGVAKLKKGETILVPRVADLPPEAYLEKAIQEAQGVQSLIVTPMVWRDKVLGFMGFDYIRQERTWSDEIVAALHVTARMFANALVRKRTEQARRESEERFRAVLEQSRDVAYKLNVETDTYEYISPSALDQIGYTAEELTAMAAAGYEALLHPEDRERLHDVYVAYYQGPQRSPLPPVLEYRLRHKNGEYRWFADSFTVVKGPDGRTVAEVGTLRDITDPKRAEKALRESEERYRSLIEDAYDGICIIQDGSFRFVNHQLSDMLGYTVEEMLDTPFSPCIHPDVLNEAQRTFEAFMQGREMVESYESILQRRDGARVEVEIVGSVILYEGREAGLLTVRDVTERNQVQRVLAEQKLSMVAASRMSALGIMASGLAHEINNPLAIISGASEQLRDVLSWDPFDRKLALDQCERILRHAQRIAGIVKGLRTFSRDGSSDPFEEASLKTIVEDALDLCTARFDAHDIALAVDTIPNDLKIECRAVQIAQVLINLLSNAYDAVEKLSRKWVRIEVRDCGDAVELAVVDSGGGMPEEIREKALDPFFTTKAVGKGTGLGLSIAMGIVESHHGTLTIDAACHNTRIVVRLPKTQPGDLPQRGTEHVLV